MEEEREFLGEGERYKVGKRKGWGWGLGEREEEGGIVGRERERDGGRERKGERKGDCTW